MKCYECCGEANIAIEDLCGIVRGLCSDCDAAYERMREALNKMCEDAIAVLEDAAGSP